MSRRQALESRDQVLNLRIGCTDAYAPAELLQHVDAGSAVRRIHHEMHGPVRFEHAAQSSEPRIGVGQMMEHSGADDVIEAPRQLVYPIDGELKDLESAQVVLSLEFLSTADARRAEIDAGNPRPGPPQGMPGSLRCAASRGCWQRLRVQLRGRGDVVLRGQLPDALLLRRGHRPGLLELRPPRGWCGLAD